MDIKKYIESGILELYVLGQLSPEEERAVEDMQSKHIDVKREIYEISQSLEKLGKIKALKAPASISEKLFSQLPKKIPVNNAANKHNDGSNYNQYLISGFLLLSSVLGFYLFLKQKNENSKLKQTYEISLKECDSISNASKNQYALLDQINNPNNKIINLQSTPNYNGISIYLHFNSVDKKNFLQLVNLPTITEDQSYQLWSLKDGADPIPLDVFNVKNSIIPVSFVDNTNTYAITIEPKGGSKSPSLDKLIGTVSVI